MKKRLVFCAVLVIGVLCGLPSHAGAWEYSYFPGCGLASYGYTDANLYVADWVPYYALHPPVYYSHVVPRAYGYSPFPYPPYVTTPEREPACPAVVRNQYAGGETAMTAASERPRRPPLRIQNPFVTQSASASVPGNATR